MSYNPATGLVYIPTTTTSSFNYTEQKDFKFAPGRQNMGIQFTFPGAGGGGGGAAPTPAPPAAKTLPAIGPAPKEGQRGALVAWDLATQKERWRGDGGASIGGGTFTTAGNLVFQVIPDGRLVVYSADKGEKLYEVQTGLRGGMGPPITYMLDGKQYIAFMGGTGAVSFNFPPPPPPPAGAAAAGAGNVGPDVANAAAAQRGGGGGGGGGAAPAPAPAGPGAGPGGPPPGPPPVAPKLLVFVLDGKG